MGGRTPECADWDAVKRELDIALQVTEASVVDWRDNSPGGLPFSKREMALSPRVDTGRVRGARS